jgi:molybdopterin-guanine dinucleotide biosynthesis protein A
VAGRELAAVVLSGGRGARLGGADKASIELGGRTLLERALAALVDVPDVVVVGPAASTPRPVTFTSEDPPGGGPAAGLLAGVRALATTPTWVVVLAVDMPLVDAGTVRRLAAAARSDGAMLVDRDGRTQPLCAVYSVAAIERAATGSASPSGHALAMRALVGGLDLQRVAATGEEAHDVDTPADLAHLRRTLGS